MAKQLSMPAAGGKGARGEAEGSLNSENVKPAIFSLVWRSVQLYIVYKADTMLSPIAHSNSNYTEIIITQDWRACINAHSHLDVPEERNF